MCQTIPALAVGIFIGFVLGMFLASYFMGLFKKDHPFNKIEGEKMKTVTGHGIRKGDFFTMNTPEDRWWKRFIYWLIRKEPPLRLKRFVVGKVINSTTLEVKS